MEEPEVRCGGAAQLDNSTAREMPHFCLTLQKTNTLLSLALHTQNTRTNSLSTGTIPV